jgi:hypothetical protein
MAVSSPYDFEVPWRPNFEAKMALVWALASALIIAFSWAVPLFSQFSALLAVGCALAAACRGYQAYQRLLDASRLRSFGKAFIALGELEKKALKAAQRRALWLGNRVSLDRHRGEQAAHPDFHSASSGRSAKPPNRPRAPTGFTASLRKTISIRNSPTWSGTP